MGFPKQLLGNCPKKKKNPNFLTLPPAMERPGGVGTFSGACLPVQGLALDHSHSSAQQRLSQDCCGWNGRGPPNLYLITNAMEVGVSLWEVTS
jgi:hypothetical protein